MNDDGTAIQNDSEAPSGLVPSNYVEAAEPLRLSRALYDYEAQNSDELDVAGEYIHSTEKERLSLAAYLQRARAKDRLLALAILFRRPRVEHLVKLRLSSGTGNSFTSLLSHSDRPTRHLPIRIPIPSEDELLRVYETDGLWLLVRKQGHDEIGDGEGKLGYVPANYVDEVSRTRRLDEGQAMRKHLWRIAQPIQQLLFSTRTVPRWKLPTPERCLSRSIHKRKRRKSALVQISRWLLRLELESKTKLMLSRCGLSL